MRAYLYTYLLFTYVHTCVCVAMADVPLDQWASYFNMRCPNINIENQTKSATLNNFEQITTFQVATTYFVKHISQSKVFIQMKRRFKA